MVYEKLSLCFSEALVKKTSVNKEDVKESSTRAVTADARLLVGREWNVTSPAFPHLMEQKAHLGFTFICRTLKRPTKHPRCL